MDPKHRTILTNLYEKIVNDVEYDYIIDSLISSTVINEQALEAIKHEKDTPSQTRKLLEIIMRRGPNAYGHFKTALEVDYKWIVNEMEKLENSDDAVDAMDVPLGQSPPLPDLPPIPSLNISRIAQMEQLQTALERLKPKNYVVLHGFKGFGKSSLANATLQNNSLVKNLFDGEFYWMKFGHQQPSPAYIMGQLNLLFHRVNDLESFSEPTSTEALKYSLDRYFKRHPNALLILEDVRNKEIIEAFNFGCKTLVLAQDLDILEGQSYETVEMNNGFTPEETMALFKKALQTDKLPKEARAIHNACKGMPMMITMLAAQFREFQESMVNSEERWTHCLNDLLRKDSRVLKDTLEKQGATFELCIGELSNDLIAYYHKLAIFVEDVTITRKTLEILWNASAFEVDNIMNKFCKKSLATRQWHVGLKMYIYEVHDLLLCYLQKVLKPDVVREMHESFVYQNLNHTLTEKSGSMKRDFSKLPKDNYIHTYIGHHMEKAGLYDMFTDIYLDFGFMEAKVYHVGTGDLLIDLKKYRKYITKNETPELVEKFEDVEQFLDQQASTLAEFRRRNCLDIVQVALKHSRSGYVRDTAKRLARERRTNLYVDHASYNSHTRNSLSEELQDIKVSCVAFTNDSEMILVGSDSGEIILWNFNLRHHVAVFDNNTDQIKSITTAKDGSYFLSMSKNGKVQMFDLVDELSKFNENHIKAISRNVKIDSSNERPNHRKSIRIFAVEEQRITDIAISEDSNRIAACTETGFLVVWHRDGKILNGPANSLNSNGFQCIAFTMRDTMLQVMDSTKGGLIIYDAYSLQYKTQFGLGTINDMIALFPIRNSNGLIVLSKSKLVLATWRIGDVTQSWPNYKTLDEINDHRGTFTCATVTEDGEYLIAADKGGTVTVFGLEKEGQILCTYKSMVNSLDSYKLDENRYLICGGNYDTFLPLVHRWTLDPRKQIPTQKSSLFDIIVRSDNENIIAVGTTKGTIQFLQKDQVLIETRAHELIASLRILEPDSSIIYGTNTGTVRVYDYKQNSTRQVMHVKGSVDFMEVLTIGNRKIVACTDGDEHLRIWSEENDTRLLDDTGKVIACYVLDKIQRFMVVGRDKIKVWDYTNWSLQEVFRTDDLINKTHCCLSPSQSMIAFATTNDQLHVAKCNSTEDSNRFKITTFHVQNTTSSISCLSFSYDEAYLAIGFEPGNISILDTHSRTEIQKFKFHRTAVTQLYWAPPVVGKYVLLSLANELAWWDISWMSDSQFRQPHLSKLSENLKTSDVNRDSNGNSEYQSSNDESSVDNIVSNSSVWEHKWPKKYPKLPGLLNVIKLDGNLAKKVWFSDDFRHFVTVDGEGNMYNLVVEEMTDT